MGALPKWACQRTLPAIRQEVGLADAHAARDKLLVESSSTAYVLSVALQNLWRPMTSGALIVPAIRNKVAPGRAAFLTSPQDGTGAVTRAMADRVLRARYAEFGAATVGEGSIHDDGAHDRLGPIFDRRPDDTGQRSAKYFEHVLGPMLHAPAGNVLEILSGNFVEESLTADLPGNIAASSWSACPRTGDPSGPVSQTMTSPGQPPRSRWAFRARGPHASCRIGTESADHSRRKRAEWQPKVQTTNKPLAHRPRRQ